MYLYVRHYFNLNKEKILDKKLIVYAHVCECTLKNVRCQYTLEKSFTEKIENSFCAMKRKKDAPLNAKIKRQNEIEFMCDHKNFYCYSCGINENK